MTSRNGFASAVRLFGANCQRVRIRSNTPSLIARQVRSSPFATSSPAEASPTAPHRSFFSEHATLIVAASSLLAGAALAYKFTPLQVLTMFQEKLPEVGSPEETAYIDRVEKQLQQSRIVKQMRAKPEFEERRMWVNAPEEYRKQAFLAGTLSGMGKFAVPGIVFVNKKTNQIVSVIHVGSLLSGFPGIVHGGLIGALLDEALARAAILPLPGQSAVTANLNINYRAPTFTNQVIAIHSHVTDFTTSKSLVAGRVESAHGHLLAEATGVFLVPKKYNLKSLADM
ncbi:HotDog domain-containing protein [Lipomyces tetrasporus]|uniref:HotDog domain-containing protein n=1 Tax=Lipomyces tetrasporus TaxID=54092 RepID=A0AAD7QU83_9ASCO|nr:HotDog domain-containing protein [Lipomyces tetrasporus]KAJ8101061.1 HotDog domain-containing protein [Lipomyces tetrasporus]